MMKQTLRNSAHLAIRKDVTRKDGSNAIILRLKIGGKKKDLALGEYCPISAWDDPKERVKRSHPGSDSINDIIQGKINRARQIIFDYKVKDKPLSLDDFCREFGIQNSKCFFEFIKSEIELEKSIGSKAEGTMSNYKKDLSKLKRFTLELSFSDVTRSFLEKYETYMRHDLKNKKNTIHRSMKFIRTFNNRAIAKGLTELYPFKQFKLTTEKTMLRFLDSDELESLRNYYDALSDNHKHKKTLKPFLFCCYTGIRYSDVLSLRYKNIVGQFLDFRIKKTAEPNRIPLIEQAKKLLNESSDTELPIFKVPCNQTTNRCLKEVAIAIGCKKRITFHSSRHTFATVALNLGIDIMVIKDVLGHADLRQTQVYAKVVEKTKEREMKKWEAAFS